MSATPSSVSARDTTVQLSTESGCGYDELNLLMRAVKQSNENWWTVIPSSLFHNDTVIQVLADTIPLDRLQENVNALGVKCDAGALGSTTKVHIVRDILQAVAPPPSGTSSVPFHAKASPAATTEADCDAARTPQNLHECECINSRLRNVRFLLSDLDFDDGSFLDDPVLLQRSVGTTIANAVDASLWISPTEGTADQTKRAGRLWSAAVVLFDMMERTDECDQSLPVFYQRHQASLSKQDAQRLRLAWAEAGSTPIPSGTNPWLGHVLTQLFSGALYTGLMTLNSAELCERLRAMPEVESTAVADLREEVRDSDLTVAEVYSHHTEAVVAAEEAAMSVDECFDERYILLLERHCMAMNSFQE